jgi:hypothetical protein
MRMQMQTKFDLNEWAWLRFIFAAVFLKLNSDVLREGIAIEFIL